MRQNDNAIIAKARAIYGHMLTPVQYDELLRRQNVQEISSYLREKTTYASALEGVQDSTIHRGQLENLLRKDVFYQYVRMMRYVRHKDSVYQFILMDMEINMILSCLRGIISGQEQDLLATLPTFIQPYASFKLMDLVDVKSTEQLYQVLEHTRYGPTLAYCMEHHPPAENGRLRFTHYEVALRTFYFQTLLDRAKASGQGIAAKQIHEALTLRAELMNIDIICRLKTYFGKDPQSIRGFLLPFRCKLSKRDMDELIEAKDLPTFMQYLSQTCYGPSISADGQYIDIETGIIRYRISRRMMHFSTDPQVVYLSFMMLRSMETEDIIRIIEGVRYRLPPEKIGRLLFHT